MEKQKSLKIRDTFRISFIVPAAIVAIGAILTIIFLILYFTSKNEALLFVLLGLLIFVGLGFVALVYFAINFFYKVYYHGLYEITRDNMKAIAQGTADFQEYPNIGNIYEISDLNEKTQVTKSVLDNAYLVTYQSDYSKLDLEYIDENQRLITFDSFKKTLQNLIFIAQSFRNVIIEVYYEMEEGELTPDTQQYLLRLYFNGFKDYENSLFTFRDNNRSLLIYLPVIDSFSRINEIITLLIKESSITVRGNNGIESIPARYAVVAYPFSSEDSLLSDLRYAKRQNKIVNFFLPERTKNNVGQKVIMNTSMNINYMSRLMSSISSLHHFTEDMDEDKETLLTLFTDLSKYLDIDEAGIIVFDEDTRVYHSFMKTEDSTLFPDKKVVPIDFIDELAKAVDEDNSYYFSKRSHANLALGRMLDYYGINSGYFYVIKKDEHPIGIIYFFNKAKDFIIDAYIRESFFMISLRISHYFESIYLARKLDLARAEADYIFSIGKYALYKVDDEMNLTEFSQNLKSAFPKLAVGEKCYKAMFGFERPCNDCMMKTFKKKIIQSKRGDLELSLTLNDRKSHNRAVLVERIKKQDQEYAPDLYNKDLLIYSFASLVNSLSDAYYAKGRGYILLLCIDNYERFIDNQGSEGFAFVLRSFIRKIKKKLKTEEVYYYNPTTLAIMFPNIGHADIITKCEQIYELSKEHYLDDGSDDQISVTYLPLAYPRGYATEHDFLRHTNEFYNSDKLEKGKDFIYFSDYSISRSASKREFMLSVIENEFSGKMSTSVNLQPMVVADSKKIYGAEILLRISDVHRNVFFSAQDIARIALQENKTYLITESIVNYVGELFKEHGGSTFKINDFKRVAINIDETYFKDPELIKKIIDISKKYQLPHNFLSFEIPEEMILDNLDKIRSFAKELADVHIIFSCDRYSGRFVGIEKLKELGFKEIKVMKGVIDGIDKDPVKLKAFTNIAETAKQNNIGISVVGVENEAQYNLLKNIDPKMLLQGYYFYKPLTRSDLLSAIISYN